MALSFDIDIYNWLLVDILKVQPTGDPVNDAVYLVLLPMAVLYLFVYSVIHNSRFQGTKVEVIMMFVIGFFIVREGYYSIFAGFSLPLLIIIMLWHTGSFIFGKKDNLQGARGDSGNRNHDLGIISSILHPMTDPLSKATRDLSRATWSEKNVREEAGRLIVHWKSLERVITNAGSSAFGKSEVVDNNLEKQEEIEEELADLARLNKVDVLGMINNDDLKKNVELKVSDH